MEDVINGPLAGIRVLDVTASLAGAYGARLLADLGADVSRLGDARGLARSTGARVFPDWMPGLHHVINAGKTPIASEASDAMGMATLRRMATDADLVFEERVHEIG